MQNYRKSNNKIISLFGDIIKPSFFAILFSIMYGVIIAIILLNLPIAEKISILIFSKTEFYQTVIITPFVEEFLKFFGYGIIFLINVKTLTEKAKLKFRYNSNEEFIVKNAFWMSLTIGLVFGILEGIIHNIFLNKPLIEVLPHAVTHIIFIIIPVILWMTYRKNIILFLPFAIFLHFINNLRYEFADSLFYIHPISILIVGITLIVTVLLFFKKFKMNFKDKKIAFK